MSVIFGFGKGQCEKDDLTEEIITLEQRILQLGIDGDCAYERAMSKLYQALIEDRKKQLCRGPR